MSLRKKYLPLAQAIRNFSKTLAGNSNYYKSLGLTPSASPADIKSAYYRLSKIYHPDRNNGSEASAEIFREISTAYEVLSKAKSRRNYDKEKLRDFEWRKSYGAPRARHDKRYKNGMGSFAKSNQGHDTRWKTKSSYSFRNAQKLNSREVEDFLTKNIKILFSSQWHHGHR